MTLTDPTLSTALGVISGTSMDAIDVALLRTDGETTIVHGPSGAYPYPEPIRAALLAVINTPADAEYGDHAALEEAVTDAHCAAVMAFIAENEINISDIDLVGLHGQTIFHRPERRLTRQLLLGQRAANRLGVPVVNRFRDADLASGGQGAPLVPLYHQALTAGLESPVMVLNLGGVANVTYLDDPTIIAFDTGPASALIDDFMRIRTGQAYDAGGATAAKGRVQTGLVARFLEHSYFAQRPPKSLDRNQFHGWLAMVDGLKDEDGAATLVAFTVESIAAALAHVPRPPLRWLVAGGGRLNLHLMTTLERRLGVPVAPVETVGWKGDDLEAECFAYLAVRAMKGRPLSVPSTTGVPFPMPGGVVWHPNRG